MKAALLGIIMLSGAAIYLTGREGGPPPSRQQAAAKQATRNPVRTVTLSWAGDLTPGSRYGLPGGNGRQQLKYVRRQLRGPDLTMVNLEGTLTSTGADKCGGSPGGNCFSFAAPPSYARGLRWAGIDVVNLANNHSLDMGPKGLKETSKAAKRAGIAATGLPGQITYLKSKGMQVALLGFAPYPWSSDLKNLPRARRMIQDASQKADVVWVAMHAGAEGSDQGSTPRGAEIAFGEDRGNTRLFAHQAVKAGADLVTGSGPHVVRGLEMYKGRLIAYSTGNFAGFNNFQLGGALSESAILQATLDSSGRIEKATWTPIWLKGPGLPRIDRRQRSLTRANRLSKADFGSRAALIAPSGNIELHP